jgi:predicted metal-dependent enzyme (double-stranded beta helix superfamily)
MRPARLRASLANGHKVWPAKTIGPPIKHWRRAAGSGMVGLLGHKGPPMAYDLQQFVADCRAVLSRDPGPNGREQVRTLLERLLSNPEFIRQYCGDEVDQGLHVLYEDPALGFQILAHINENPRSSPPHDHGASWAIYGQATQYTDMIEWERADGSDLGQASLKPAKTYRLMPGQAGLYQDGAIHSIAYPSKARFIRVTGTNLDRIHRLSFDLATGKTTRMPPQQAT